MMSRTNNRGTRIRAPRKGLLGPASDLDFEETWTRISVALQDMHQKTASNLSFEEIYRYAYKIVLRKKGSEFYSKLMDFEKQWLKYTVHGRLANSTAQSLYAKDAEESSAVRSAERANEGNKFLNAVKAEFGDHQLVMNMATDVFMYLDRIYCSSERQPTIYAAGMAAFRDQVLRVPIPGSPVKPEDLLISVLLENIALDRNGYHVDKVVMKACVGVLEGLHDSPFETAESRLYLTSFEPQFLNASRTHYQELAARLIHEADAAGYCQATLDHIRSEITRCQTMLSEETKPKIVAVLEDELIKYKLRELIATSSGVQHMVDNERFQDIKLLYVINSRVDQDKSEMTKAFQRGMQEIGARINDAAIQQATGHGSESADGKPKPVSDRAAASATAAAIQWVEAVLLLKDKYDRIWKDSLNSDPVIQPALDRSFTETINLLPRCTEFLSLFIDDNMKKGLKNKSDSEVDEVLGKAIILLRYVADRDMFERYYKKHLCKRLLMGKSISLDHEQEMVRKMKVELGNSFVAKLEVMFKDMGVSEDLSAAYRSQVSASGSRDGKRVDLSISVLTSMTWPLESMQTSDSDEIKSRAQCIYPPELDRVKKSFEAFYEGKHTGRTLTWMAHMGTVEVRGFYPSGRKELNVSTFAAIILLLFNDLPADAYLTFDDIQARTNIPKNDLVRNLQSLAVAPKTRLLKKEPMTKEVKETDRFFYNAKFKSESSRVKIGVVAGTGSNNKVEGERERKETERKNDESRGAAIDAAVVRILKQRRKALHMELVTDTISLLSVTFKPDPAMIKRRISSLIEREYMVRDEHNKDLYHYLA